MTRSTAFKPTLVIAGPGAGKTTQLVREIQRLLPTLQPNRVLAAITYTNAATDSIRRQLAQATQVPPNVFVGTNHAFLSQFILMPYASMCGLAPADFIYVAVDLDQLVEQRLHKANLQTQTPQQRVIARNAIAGRLLGSGKIPFEKMTSLARELTKDKRLRALLCCRLQYLLIDEFQDVDIGQYEIFDRIRKGGKTQIYAVGDPEQYISGYTYAVRGVKQHPFSEIPIHELRRIAEVHYEYQNRRSCSAIVSFANCLRPEPRQHETHLDGPKSGVFFLRATNLHDIIVSFRELVPSESRDGRKSTVLYLSREGDTLADCANTFGLTPVSNRRSSLSRMMGDALALLCECTGLTQERIRSDFDLDPIGIRKLGIRLLRAIKEGHIGSTDTALTFIRSSFKLPIDAPDETHLDERLAPLRELLTMPMAAAIPNHQYATIHKAKGLEADAVLVVAESKSQFEKWLITDPQERASDKQDMCRIGYVGFTRAKDVLCIACLQRASGNALAELRSMGVRFHPRQPELQPSLFDQEL